MYNSRGFLLFPLQSKILSLLLSVYIEQLILHPFSFRLQSWPEGLNSRPRKQIMNLSEMACCWFECFLQRENNNVKLQVENE